MKKLPYIVIAVLLAIIWFQGCKEQPKPKDRIIIKEIKGEFEPIKPIKTKPITQKYIDSVKSTVKRSESNKKYLNDISELYAENERLKQNYIDADSLKRELIYLKSIQLSEFYHEFDNDTINIMVKGIVQGEVKQLQPFYKIKERTIPIPEVKFRMLVGGGVGINKELNQGVYKFNLSFQNKNYNIIRASYMQIGQQKYGIAEYDFSLFKIKKP